MVVQNFLKKLVLPGDHSCKFYSHDFIFRKNKIGKMFTETKIIKNTYDLKELLKKWKFKLIIAVFFRQPSIINIKFIFLKFYTIINSKWFTSDL